MKKMRLYVDTSVVGGCIDDEFRDESLKLMDMFKRGDATMLVSDLLVKELELAPESVRSVIMDLPDVSVEGISMDEESGELMERYLKAGVVGPAQKNDAMHVALASVAKADMIVSWNFKHIVHYDKIRAFNAINLQEGYLPIDIRSPLEVV